MKKFILFVFILSILVGCSSLKSNTKLNSINEETIDTNTEKHTIIEQNINPSTAVANGAYSIYSGGKNFIVVSILYTNNSNEVKSFYDEYNIMAFQNGIEVYQNNSWNCTQFDLKAVAAHIQAKYSTNVYMAFEAKDVISPILIELTPKGNATSQKVSLNINGQYYVSQKQIDTQKKAEEAKIRRSNFITKLNNLVSNQNKDYAIYDVNKDGISDVIFFNYYQYDIYLYQNGQFNYITSMDSKNGMYGSRKNGFYILEYYNDSIYYNKYEYYDNHFQYNRNESVEKFGGKYYVDAKETSRENFESNANELNTLIVNFSAPTNKSMINNAKFK